jgi:ABC-type transporter Mla subunit MlaD
MPMTLNRNAIPVLAIVAAAGLTITACSEESREEATTAVTDAANSAADATKDAAKDVQAAAMEAKDKFVDGAATQLNALETQVTDFINKARESMPDGSAEVNRVRDELNKAIANAKVELEKVRNAGAEGWKDASASFQQTMAELQRSFNQVKEQFANSMPKMPG